MRGLAGALLALSGCGGSGRRRPTHTPARSAVAHRLAIGLSEQNANLLTAGPTELAAARGFLVALHPRFIRVLVDWSQLQPDPRRPPRLDAPQSGCARTVGPCATYDGLRAEFEAIRSQGWIPVLAIYGVPQWAARPASGCTRPGGSQSRSRPIASAALPAYKALIEALQALGRSVKLALPWWAPWNEPNHDYFISPQRAICDAHAPALGPALYASLVREMASMLAPGQSMVLGELASYVQPAPRASSIAEFVGALPRDVVCASAVWSLHDYAPAGDEALRALESALDARGPCGARARIWITETGAPSPDARVADAARGCARIAAALNAWNADPRVDAAFQYEFREDPYFRTGLADERLTRLFPAYGVWQRWGAGGAPAHC